MSGPKLSQAELEAIRQQELERQRQEQLKRLREARDRYQQACSRCSGLFASAEQAASGLGPAHRLDALHEIRQIRDAFAITQLINEKDPEVYTRAADSLLRRAELLSRQLQDVLGTYESRAQVMKQLSDSDTDRQTFENSLRERGQTVRAAALDFHWDQDGRRLRQALDSLQQHCQSLSRDPGSPRMQAFAQSALKALGALDPSRPREAAAAILSLVNDEEELRRQLQEFSRLYDDYAALALTLDQTPEGPDSFSDAAQLQARIRELSDQYRRKDEMDFIADQINDAMVSLGYGFITSRVLTRKDSSEMDLSLYSADDRTGIAVYTDQSGAVMMRMTVLGQDSAITDEDRDFSYQRQIDFCFGHPDIVRELQRRGVFLKQYSYQPPDRKYTYKIGMGGRNAAAARTDHTDRRKRRRAGKKKMSAV